MEAIFWLCAGIVLYTYVGYPLLLGLLGLFWARPRVLEPYSGSVSVVLVAHNEEENIERRLCELLDLLRNSRVAGEVILVSDGSTDRTVAIARKISAPGRLSVVERDDNSGKAAALTAGCFMARGDILVMADARQRWAPDALTRLLENFADPSVGAVSGNLRLESAPGVMTGVGLYWRFEKWLRKKESDVHAQVGVTGAICAVRRQLFRPIPAGTLLDDVYWPLQVVMQKKRVVYDDRAVAYDRLPDNARDEFRRKVRTLSGNFQLAARLPAALLPWRNPIWFQFVSHKLLRLVVPWALIGLFLATLSLLDSAFFRCALYAQAAGYTLAVIGLTSSPGGRTERRSEPRFGVPLAGAAASFLVLNAAAFLGFWVWLSGRAGQSWRKIAYHTHDAGAPTQASAMG